MIWLNQIILFLSCVFEIYILYDFFYQFFGVKTPWSNTLARKTLIIVTIFLLYCVNYLDRPTINLIFVPVIFILFVFTCFEGSIWIRFGYFVLAYIIMFACEFLFTILLNIPAFVQGKSSVTSLASMPWQFFTLKLLTYIIFLIVKQIPKNTKKRMNAQTFLMYLMVPVSSIGIMLSTYYSGLDVSENLTLESILVGCFAFLLLGNIIMFYVFNRYSEQMERGMQQELIITKQNMDLKYYDQIEHLNEKYKEFIHNTSHHLKTIGQLAQGDNGGEIQGILNELNIELEQNETIIYSDNHTMNAILSEKKSEAEKIAINFDVYVEPGVRFSSITPPDIIVMLGNLLDNAMTAASQNQQDRKVITRIFVNNDGFNIIKIVNDYNGVVKMDQGKFLTTKRDNELHGIGLESVKNTAKKYGGYLECIPGDKQFTAILVLPIN